VADKRTDNLRKNRLIVRPDATVAYDDRFVAADLECDERHWLRR
jgi:hypothetical protein